jgi:hypothetical protein
VLDCVASQLSTFNEQQSLRDIDRELGDGEEFAGEKDLSKKDTEKKKAGLMASTFVPGQRLSLTVKLPC